MKRMVFVVCCLLSLWCISPQFSFAAVPSISKAPFGTMPDGQKVDKYTLTNTHGMRVQIITYGGIVTSLRVPDRHRHFSDVVLGYDTLDGYLKDTSYLGALIGRYGNRIAKGKFTLDGKSYTLATNNAPNHLHGGVRGFNRRVWQAHPVRRRGEVALELTLFSPDGDEGYPGDLNVRVVFTLDNSSQLRIDYRAVTDADTIVNLTHHSYFNLAGAGTASVLKHRLMLAANRFTPIDSTSIPLGELRPVKGTPFDFRRSHRVGERISADDIQIRNGQGYDHNFVLNHARGVLGLAARVTEPTSGRVLTVYTTEPGIQFYSGNFLNGAIGKDGKTYPRRSALCLEAQHYPDSPNEPSYPTTELKPGQTYRQTTIYAFSN